jgi:DNA-binding transcriptional MerR regulator
MLPTKAHRVAMAEKLVPTGVAAEAIGVGHSTLARWWKERLVEPQLVTPGGHARWDVDALRNQLRANRDRLK